MGGNGGRAWQGAVAIDRLARAALGIAARRQIATAQIWQRAGDRREFAQIRRAVRRRRDQLRGVRMARTLEQLARSEERRVGKECRL